LNFHPLTIICGHYGTGKTNLSLNIAVDAAKAGKSVTLVDLDIVNPYFRSSDYSDLLQKHGIKLIAPGSAGSTLDVPALPAEISSVFEKHDFVLFDVGGDDAGATALGRFAPNIIRHGYEMLYVINRYRPMPTKSQDAAALLSEIEAVSRLKATGIVNNSHLMALTTVQTVLDSLEFADETARELGLPVKMTTVPETFSGVPDIPGIYPVKIYVRTPWTQMQ
jgi:nitrogenase subunit NifH